MSTYEPIADRDGSSAPTGADTPSRSVAVSGAGSAAGLTAVAGTDAQTGPERVGVGVAVGVGSVGPADVAGGTAENAAEDETEDARSWRWSRDLLVLVGVCLLALLIVNAYVARPFAVPSGSMENTLRPGDRLVVNKLAYAFGGHVRRGDVVVFDGVGSFLPESAQPAGPASGLRDLGRDLGLAPAGDTVYVKRVIGVGGDRVTSPGPGGPLTVNGVPLDESSYLQAGEAPSSVAFDVVVPAGGLWMMGDHRSTSRDSRDHIGEAGGGFVPERKVIGRADWVVFPVGHWASLDRPASFSVLGGTGGHGDQG